MPANFKPIFPVTPVVAVANISTANTARTATGVTNLTLVRAGGTNGTRVDRVRIQATATTTAGMIRLWLYSGTGNAQLRHEEVVSAVTVGASTPAYNTEVTFADLLIPTGWSLYASTEKSEAFNIILHGGDY